MLSLNKNLLNQLNNDLDWEKIKIDNWDRKLLKTLKNNPNSFGIINAFKNGFLKNKPKNIEQSKIYWILNIVTTNKKILDENLHPNICLKNGDEYIGLHCSSDSKAFKKYIKILILSKPYYVCLERIYILSKNFIKSFLISDSLKVQLEKGAIEKIKNKLSYEQNITFIYQDFSENILKFKILQNKNERGLNEKIWISF